MAERTLLKLQKYSEDPGSAEKGGLYENTPVSTWVEAFKEAAKTLPLNKISDPVETEYGYHIMKVEARTEADYAKLTAEQKETLKASWLQLKSIHSCKKIWKKSSKK